MSYTWMPQRMLDHFDFSPPERASMTLHISKLADLYDLKHVQDVDEVVLETGAIKRSGALRHALKYAVWALKPGGMLIVRDDGPDADDATPFTVPFFLVTQQVFKLLAGWAEIVSIDRPKREILLTRTGAVPPNNWSAGIVFSGNASEVPVVERCLEGLRRQPELSGADGQIIVCGPEAGREHFARSCDVEYLAFENVPGPRAFTTRKKNAIAAAARNAKLAIMHARIVLADGALAAMPAHFDIATPCVEYHHEGHRLPYLDWIMAPTVDGDQVPRVLSSGTGYRRDRYLELLAKGGRAYIDGGLFIARRDVLLRCALSDDLAWGEAEDVEWCGRAQGQGYLVDLELRSLATSQSYKFGERQLMKPGLTRATAPLRRRVRQVLMHARHLLGG